MRTKTMSAEERLWWYSHFFDVVEVNSSFYAIPSEDTLRAWVERTPAGFLFNIKAYGLLTGHQLTSRACLRHSGRCSRQPCAANGPAEFRTARSTTTLGRGRSPSCARHSSRSSGRDKLGYVLFQLAPWLKRSDEVMAYLATLTRELPRRVVAIEFRNRSWFGEHTEETLKFLQRHGLATSRSMGHAARRACPRSPR
jgi:uncharacterized protein YecE (DUF72 family)